MKSAGACLALLQQATSWTAKQAADVPGAVTPAASAATGSPGVAEGNTCQLSRSRLQPRMLPRNESYWGPMLSMCPPGTDAVLPADIVQRIIAECSD